ncbi:Oxysterol-binding protein-related protein 2A [Ranunculus cassubicifolius]
MFLSNTIGEASTLLRKLISSKINSRHRLELVWIQALGSNHSLFSLRQLNDDRLSRIPTDISISTNKLRKRFVEEGTDEVLVRDCEQIVLLEFSEIHGHLKVLCVERSNLLNTLRQLELNSKSEKNGGFHNFFLENGGFIGVWSSIFTLGFFCSMQELEEIPDDDKASYFDTREYLGDSPLVNMHVESEISNFRYPHIERRKKLPDPIEKEKGVSLWSMIKDNVGKDLTQVCLPVYFNEPISSLQKCFEDLEYSYLLDRAYEYGKKPNPRFCTMLNVAAFAIFGYASSEGRETYEADYPDKGVHFFSEKVSNQPILIACHCEGRGWEFWGDSNLKTRFCGCSIQLDPVGALTLEFDDGEIFQWSKVTTAIHNLILGKIYCDHHGTMDIRGNKQHSCILKFKEQSILDRNPHQVQGFVEDDMREKVATLFGKWDDSISTPNTELLWKINKPSVNLTRYNLTSFAISLNELTPGLQEKLPPTDSRLRPDQRHLENGEYEKANAEKLRKLQENGWKQRWFEKDAESGAFRYVGGYWEAREQEKWDTCPQIFSELVVGDSCESL